MGIIHGKTPSSSALISTDSALTNKTTWFYLATLCVSIVAIALAILLLVKAIVSGVQAFYSAALAPAIALTGSIIASMTGFYVVNQQQQLGIQLEVLKDRSSQQLERLKVQLDSKKMAYRELSGAAAVYYYTLRSSSINAWDGAAVEKAELGMIKASHYLIYVDNDLVKSWTDFWQEAQHIFRTVRSAGLFVSKERLLRKEMLKFIQEDGVSLNLRDRYLRLHSKAKELLTDD